MRLIQSELVKETEDGGVSPPKSKGIITQRWVNYGDPMTIMPGCCIANLVKGAAKGAAAGGLVSGIVTANVLSYVFLIPS